MAPLVAEYDRHMDQMAEQMEKYEVNEPLKFRFIDMTNWRLLNQALNKWKHGDILTLFCSYCGGILLFKYENLNLTIAFHLLPFNQQMQMAAFKKKVEEVVMENER